MADPDVPSDRDGPSLELPKLSLRRRRRAPRKPEAVAPTVRAVDLEPAPDHGPPALFTDDAAVEPAAPRRGVPRPSGRVAAMLTGAAVGLLAVGATWMLVRFCGWVTGTSSCGNPGILLLLVAVLALGVAGAVLLRALGVVAPGSTSALGMALLCVVTILFFDDALFSRWMTVVLPVLSLAAYALAHAVTTTAATAEA